MLPDFKLKRTKCQQRWYGSYKINRVVSGFFRQFYNFDLCSANFWEREDFDCLLLWFLNNHKPIQTIASVRKYCQDCD